MLAIVSGAQNSYANDGLDRLLVELRYQQGVERVRAMKIASRKKLRLGKTLLRTIQYETDSPTFVCSK